MTMRLIKAVFFLVLIINLSACKKEDDDNPLPDNMDYKQEMRNFVQEISAYSKSIHPTFAIIPQNGADLVSTNGDDTGSPNMTYINAIGIGQEDLLYGYDADDQATSAADTEWIRHFLDMAKNNGSFKIMVTDYCSTHSKMDNSYALNNASGYISFAADHRELDHMPDYPEQIHHENASVISNLQDAKNFLYLITPDNEYDTKQAFVDAVKSTNYDYIIMDLFFDGQEFSVAQIEELKQKANGGKRLLICYMSIGEAEDYRYYWNDDWANNHPLWLEKENPNWPGNYNVRYWEDDWKNIIFGNDYSYLDKILNAGFDGVYLDIIEGFEYFEEQ